LGGDGVSCGHLRVHGEALQEKEGKKRKGTAGSMSALTVDPRKKKVPNNRLQNKWNWPVWEAKASGIRGLSIAGVLTGTHWETSAGSLLAPYVTWEQLLTDRREGRVKN